jgi:hypothetical protein
MHCTINCWILGEHGEKEKIIMGMINIIKALHIL